ncbi:MAG: 3-hydroxyacyl-CoA dehydrogenase/enoyl-CoA hydratase family protein [Bacteroidia bacterium]
MKTIKTVGVVGAGTMGSALAQKFAQEGFKVILVDTEMKFVEKGLGQIKNILNEAMKRHLFSSEQINSFLDNLKGSDNLSDLKVCDIIVEAIYENFKAKCDLFKKISSIVPIDTILATNTSSFSITELSSSVKNPERFIGLHYFYHAAKNRLVEIVPGLKTSKETLKAARQFSILSGKDAIVCADAYGFVVNRFFVPWLNEAVRLHEENIAPIGVIEQVCKETFGIDLGPFELMNATGIPVAYHAEKTLEIFGNLYKASKALEKQVEEKQPWRWEKSIDLLTNTTHPTVIKEIKDRMLGIVFFICSQIIDEKICTATEINRGAKIGLRWKRGPIDLMRKMDSDEVLRLIVKIVDRYNMILPVSIGEKHWKSTNVKLEKRGSIAVITMDQPESQNALSEETMQQLAYCFISAERNPSIKTIFITGSGKAFVAGADIKFFVNKIKDHMICDIEKFTEFGQKVFERIDKSKKKVVAVINGLALGGGLEFALCADVILALPKAQMAFPETSIGIYPGLGGTQRSVKKIGKGLSKYLIYTGKALSANEAKEIGLVDKVISAEEMFSLLEGQTPIPETQKVKLSNKWRAIAGLFENNSLSDILVLKEEIEKIIKSVCFKAPIALRLADKLISEGRGCKSELQHLREVFSTSDALLGLTSIGEKVNYQGR